MDNGEFDIGAMVNKLMGDPKVAEMIKGLKEAEPRQDKPPAPKEAASEDLSEIYQRLPDIISTLSPLMKDGEKRSGGASSEKRNRLLAALKPYLSTNRQGMIDSIMSYSKLASLLDLLPDKNSLK